MGRSLEMRRAACLHAGLRHLKFGVLTPVRAWAILNQIGHRSAAMVRRYIREGSLFSENAVAGVGL